MTILATPAAYRHALQQSAAGSYSTVSASTPTNPKPYSLELRLLPDTATTLQQSTLLALSYLSHLHSRVLVLPWTPNSVSTNTSTLSAKFPTSISVPCVMFDLAFLHWSYGQSLAASSVLNSTIATLSFMAPHMETSTSYNWFKIRSLDSSPAQENLTTYLQSLLNSTGYLSHTG